MIEFKKTINEAIDKRIHPITGFKTNWRQELQKNNKDKRTELNKKYREREKKRLSERYLEQKK